MASDSDDQRGDGEQIELLCVNDGEQVLLLVPILQGFVGHRGKRIGLADILDQVE